MQKDMGKSKLQAGKQYAIQVTWTKSEPDSSAATDTPAKIKMKNTQKKYGFDHTAITVGKFEKTGKNHDLDFVGD